MIGIQANEFVIGFQFFFFVACFPIIQTGIDQQDIGGQLSDVDLFIPGLFVQLQISFSCGSACGSLLFQILDICQTQGKGLI